MNKTYEVAGRWINESRISKEALEIGYLDYDALASMLYDGMILNNGLDVMSFLEDIPEGVHLERYKEHLEDYEIDEDEYHYTDYIYDALESVYQCYMVSDRDSRFLIEAGELVLYSEELNINLWCIGHYGTSWSYVYSGAKIERID